MYIRIWKEHWALRNIIISKEKLEVIYLKKIEVLSVYAEVFKKISMIDCAISVIDENGTVINYIPPTNLVLNNIEVGSKVQPGSAQAEAWETRKEVRRDISAKVFGIAVRAIAVPIFEEKKFIGVVAVAIDMKAQDNLHVAAEFVSSSAEKIGTTAEEVAATAETLSTNLKELLDNSSNVLKDVQRTDGILKFVSGIAGNSNLLGLNAAIEAARAGEQGRGFAVVAKEIRKMAVDSDKAVSEIKTIIDSIHESTSNIVSAIENTSLLSEQQATATEQIAVSVQELAKSAVNIEEIARGL